MNELLLCMSEAPCWSAYPNPVVTWATYVSLAVLAFVVYKILSILEPVMVDVVIRARAFLYEKVQA